jgi:hypothetical protein
MKTLKVIVCKANEGVSAHLPELDGYVIARDFEFPTITGYRFP